MKKARKGFTLIELLIVITIMASLSAMMAITSGGATSRAKASSIVANIEACKTAAAVFYSDHWQDATITVNTTPDVKMSEATAEAFLGNTAAGYEYVPNFSDFSTGNIVFTVDTTTNEGKGRDNWAIKVTFKVTFKDEAEADNISMALAKAKGYSGMYTAATAASGTEGEEGYVAAKDAKCRHTFTVNLTTGVITPSESDN